MRITGSLKARIRRLKKRIRPWARQGSRLVITRVEIDQDGNECKKISRVVNLP